MKKVKSIMIALVLALSLGTVSANAATVSTDSKTLGKGFTDAWTSTQINTSTRTFKVGYNKTLINEDFTHTYHKNNAHKAYVKNSGSAHTANGKAGKYAKSEIRHHAGTVYYSYTY